MKIDINSFIQKIKTQLLNSCDSAHEAEQQAWWLLEELLQNPKAQLLLKKTIVLTDTQQQTLEKWIKQRTEEKKPLQYISGHVPFCNLDIKVTPPILIPRPETEEWVTWLIKKLKTLEKEKLNILDLGTGSGCIALSIAKALPNGNIIGTDINPEAILLAEENKKHNNIKNAEFLCSSFYEKIQNIRVDLIVSNPPYIDIQDWTTLSKTVRNWEDKKALVANHKGFAAFETIIKQAKKHLKENTKLKQFEIPQIVLEIGMGQEKKIENILKEAQFNNIKVFKDLEGINRWVTASL
jgi:release factor glutamine methyltransferase